ncbi:MULTISPECIES: hypothetical protein [Sphingomonas]|uniref:hypothetical protein n=1 Tax=Sphingomonas TaxID=13687 RepID=UPI0013B3FCE8|nr:MULTISPECIES: hypothetical protein [Sphingomonas]
MRRIFDVLAVAALAGGITFLLRWWLTVDSIWPAVGGAILGTGIREGWVAFRRERMSQP